MVPAVFLLSPVVNAQEVVENIEIATDAAQDGTPDFMGADEPERRPGEVPAMFRDDSMLDENHSNTYMHTTSDLSFELSPNSCVLIKEI